MLAVYALTRIAALFYVFYDLNELQGCPLFISKTNLRKLMKSKAITACKFITKLSSPLNFVYLDPFVRDSNILYITRSLLVHCG